MTVALALSLLAALIGEAGAARMLARGLSLEAHTEAAASQRRAAAGSGWLKSRKRWCVSSEAVLSCDERSIIEVVSAFYADVPRAEGVACAPRPGDGPASCETNATGGVSGLCRGRRRCAVPPSSHPSCATITAIRIVWECADGSPGTADADLQRVQPQAKGEEAKRLAAAGGAEQHPEEVMETKKQPEEAPWEQIEEDDDDFVRGDVMPLKRAELDSEVQKFKEDGGVKVSFEPCYRIWGWMGPLRRINLWGNPTDCPEREGCFKLRWADGRVYKDPQQPPSREEVLQASLSEGKDSWWVTFRGIGVQKNDYYTWGVCLPDREPEGMYYALAVFHSLRALALDVPRILH
mmetsp:Transcript_25089/g.79727  ORF Transcript_25089/g.79727 Transcript_25089/m.79727 type:complete len:350 (-) Transcript_25089:98-1147(-)